jgi:hypothetical protein
MALNVAYDGLVADVAEIAGAGRAYLTQEAANESQVVNAGARCQPTFLSQMIAELREYLVLRGTRRRWRRWYMPASRNTDSNRFIAGRSPDWMDRSPARYLRYRSVMWSSRSVSFSPHL